MDNTLTILVCRHCGKKSDGTMHICVGKSCPRCRRIEDTEGIIEVIDEIANSYLCQLYDDEMRVIAIAIQKFVKEGK